MFILTTNYPAILTDNVAYNVHVKNVNYVKYFFWDLFLFFAW